MDNNMYYQGQPMAPEPKKNNGMKIAIIALAVLLVAIIVALVLYFVLGKSGGKNYSETITSAEKYVEDGNYEDAIIAYEEAIEIDPENAEAYLALAEIYADQGAIEDAELVLSKGIDNTGSARMETMLDKIRAAVDNGEKVDITGYSESTELAWNTSYLQKFVNNSFNRFTVDFGAMVSAQKDDAGYLEVKHKEIDATFYYANTSSNSDIVDSTRNTPTSSGMPAAIRLDDLSYLFRNFTGYASLERIQLLAGKKIQPKEVDGKTILEIERDDCIVRIETDKSGNIVSANAWNEIILTGANQKKDGLAKIMGVVISATTGDGVPNAELSFRDIGGSKTTTAKTASDGSFSVEVEPATYVIQIQAEGYITEEFEYTVSDIDTYSGVQFVISPSLGDGTARIVLEWNAKPDDLDSYLDGKASDGTDVHVNFTNKTVNSGGKTIATLDVDDTTGYGPETTTLNDLAGSYTFTVVDYGQTGTMASNGATVKVYMPDGTVTTIQLSSGSGVVNVWTVLKIEGGKLTVIDQPGD